MRVLTMNIHHSYFNHFILSSSVIVSTDTGKIFDYGCCLKEGGNNFSSNHRQVTSLHTISIQEVCGSLAPCPVTLAVAALASAGSRARGASGTRCTAARALPARLQFIFHLATSITFAVVAALFLTQRHQCAKRGKDEEHLPKANRNSRADHICFQLCLCLKLTATQLFMV